MARENHPPPLPPRGPVYVFRVVSCRVLPVLRAPCVLLNIMFFIRGGRDPRGRFGLFSL